MKRKSRTLSCAGVFLFFLWFCVSCATRNYENIDRRIRAGEYENALQTLEKEKKQLFGKGDDILYCLDRGMIAHYAAKYDDSTGILQEGELKIEEAYTKSISQHAASYLLNDKTIEYPGEDYEDLYLNIFNALNYHHLNKSEDAMVEIRRMEEKLRTLAVKYNVIDQQLAKDSRSAKVDTNVKVQFSDSALARYLGILFYRSGGHYDDVRIDYQSLKRVFDEQKIVYDFPPPSSLDGELSIPKGKARLNVLAFSGLSPIKVEEAVRIPLGYNWIKIALPKMVKRPQNIGSIEVAFADGKTLRLELLEDIQNVAIETFKKRQKISEVKSVVRATVKGATATGFTAVGDAKNDATLGLIGIALQIFAEASESADTRCSRYFPARAFVGGLTLDPGEYSFSVNYYTTQGHLAASFPHENIKLEAGALNLFETCLPGK